MTLTLLERLNRIDAEIGYCEVVMSEIAARQLDTSLSAEDCLVLFDEGVALTFEIDDLEREYTATILEAMP